MALPQNLTPKFNHRYYGPYKVVHSYNGVTFRYSLDLPKHWRIHNAFHISLKRFIPDTKY